MIAPLVLEQPDDRKLLAWLREANLQTFDRFGRRWDARRESKLLAGGQRTCFYALGPMIKFLARTVLKRKHNRWDRDMPVCDILNNALDAKDGFTSIGFPIECDITNLQLEY